MTETERPHHFSDWSRTVPNVRGAMSDVAFESKQFENIPDEDWRRFFDVNVLSGVRLARLVLPAMRQANWGRIIFISSESAVQIPAEMIHYGMTKTAQLAVSRGLAESMAGTGITVNTPQEAASLVAYVASPLASATTGAALRVDGGVVKSAF